MIGVQSLESLPQCAETPLVRLRIGRWVAVLRRVSWAAWRWVCSTQSAMRARSERRILRVAESVSLGEKRSVHVIEVDGQRLLVGASAAGVTLLSQLAPAKEAWQSTVKDLVFADVMERCGSTKPAKRRVRTATVAKETA